MANEQLNPASVAEHSSTRRPRTPIVAIWISVVALVLAVGLVLPYLAQSSRLPLLILALAAAAAIAGIVLAIRARRGPARAWAPGLICALIAFVITATMGVVFIVGLVSATSMNIVELHGHGPEGSSAMVDSDVGTRIETWPSDGRATISTTGSWAELTLVAPTDATSQTVSCQVIWNGDVVVEESSDSGTVTCRYDAG